MSDILKGELQDSQGNTIYPHTEADVVFCADGETAQSKLTKYEDALGNVTGVTDSLEVDDSKVLVSSKALHKVNSSLVANGSQLYMDYHDGKYGVNTDPERGADTFIPFRSISSIKVQTKLIQTSKSWYDWTVNLVIDDVVVASYTHSIGTHAVYTCYSPDGGSVTVGNVINPGTMIDYMQE